MKIAPTCRGVLTDDLVEYWSESIRNMTDRQFREWLDSALRHGIPAYSDYSITELTEEWESNIGEMEEEA
jgi:hypothetical protein